MTPATEPAPRASWGLDVLRAGAIVLLASILGMAANHFSSRPLQIVQPSGGPGALPDKEPRISIDELKKAFTAGTPLLILDVRRDDAFQRGHCPQAVHAPAEDFLTHYQRLGLGDLAEAVERVVVVCDSDQCPSGDRVAAELQRLKHANVVVLEGGWEAYRRSDLDVAGSRE